MLLFYYTKNIRYITFGGNFAATLLGVPLRYFIRV